MSFSLSGSVITQSGTDTSLAGLAGIAGVTVTGSSGRKTYTLTGLQLVVSGALTVDPEVEYLVFAEGIAQPQINVTGASAVLTVGAATSYAPPTYPAITIETIGTYNTFQFRVQSSGRLIHNRGLISCRGGLQIASNAGASFIGAYLHFGKGTDLVRGRLYAHSSLLTYGAYAIISGDGIEVTSIAALSNVTVSDPALVGVVGEAFGTLASPYVLTSVKLLGASASVYPWSDCVWKLVDFVGGGGVLKRCGGVTAGRRTLIQTFVTANTTVTAAGSAVTGAYVFSRDSNNGSREVFDTRGGASFDGTADVFVSAVTSGGAASLSLIVQNWSYSAANVAYTDWRTVAAGNTRTVYSKGYTIQPVSSSVDTRYGAQAVPLVALPDTAVTLSASAAAALTALATLDDLYDVAKAWSVASGNLEYPAAAAQPITSSGGAVNLGDMDLVIDATAAAAFAINTSTHTVTVKASTLAAGSKHTRLTTTGTVSTANGATITALYTDSAGTHVTITAASLISGSRVQLYNVTDSAEILNTTLGSTGLSYATTWAADKTIRLRADHADYLPLEATGILTASGLTFLAEQAADTVYVGNGVDGSTVSEFEADGLAIHVDVDDPDGYTLVQRLYAWLQHYQTTEEGIASEFFGAMLASDSANYQIDQDKADIHLDNIAASPLMIVGGYLTRKDGSTVIAATSGSIQMDPGRAYVAPGGAAITVPDGERVITLASGGYLARG